MSVLQQVRQLSDGTIANCIRQAQDEKSIYIGFEPSCFDVVTAVRNELYRFTERSKVVHHSWVDAFINFNIETKSAVQGALFNYCKDHIEQYGGMPLDFEIELCGIMSTYSFDCITALLTESQHSQLSTLIAKQN